MQDGPAEPARVVERVNRLYCDVSPRGRFAKLFFGVVDPETGLLDFVNAGHDRPLLVRPDGQLEQLSEGGAVLGLLPEGRYEAGQVTLGVDDLLVLYSDGVTDRGSSGGDGFGLERLGESARRVRADPARLALYSLLGEVQGHSGGQPPEDDLTLVALKLRRLS
jgi:sigma-B regulation protein RsbU (phosphoserine phosphatase)